LTPPQAVNKATAQPPSQIEQAVVSQEKLADTSDDEEVTQGILSRILANYKKKEQPTSNNKTWQGEAHSLLQQTNPTPTSRALAGGESVDEPLLSPTQIARRLRDIQPQDRVKGDGNQ